MRIAVCFSGQMRNYEHNAGWLATLREHHTVDVYVHTWANRGVSTDLNRSFPTGFAKFVTIGMHDERPIGGELFTDIIDQLHPQTITPEALQQVYEPKQAVIEPLPPNYDDTRTLHGLTCPKAITDYRPRYYHNLAMFYKIWACDQLRQATEAAEGFTYDMVIRVRPDHQITLGDLSFFSPETFADDHRVYAAKAIQSQSGLPYVSDQFACGNSHAMKHYCSIWPALPAYWDEANYPDWPIEQRVIGLLVHKHLELNGCTITKLAKEHLNHDLIGQDYSLNDVFAFSHALPSQLFNTGLAMRNEVIYQHIKETFETPPVDTATGEASQPLTPAELLTYFQSLNYPLEDALTAHLYLTKVSKQPLDIQAFEVEHRRALTALTHCKESSAAVLLMSLLSKANLSSQALQYAKSRITCHPAEADAYYFAYLGLKAKQPDEALSYYAQYCQRIKPKFLLNHGLKLAQLLAKRSYYEDALNWLNKVEAASKLTQQPLPDLLDFREQWLQLLAQQPEKKKLLSIANPVEDGLYELALANWLTKPLSPAIQQVHLLTLPALPPEAFRSFVSKPLPRFKPNTLLVRGFLPKIIGEFSIMCKGHNNLLIVEEGVKLLNTHLRFADNGFIYIGKKCIIEGALIVGSQCFVTVGQHTRFNKSCRLHAHEATGITVGENCLLADIRFRTCDSHSIVSCSTGERVNPSKSIKIGNNVWLAEGVQVYKGVTIGEGSVIASHAIVTKNIPSYCVAAGLPAQPVKHNVTWDIKLLPIESPVLTY
jgi:acetyltransferase-like isoleucine patch superfamily enzyme